MRRWERLRRRESNRQRKLPRRVYTGRSGPGLELSIARGAADPPWNVAVPLKLFKSLE